MGKKVLIIRLGAIGDVVETTGLLRSLKKIGCEIDYLTGNTPSALLENDPDINNLFIWTKKDYPSVIKLGKKLSKEKYDIIFNLQPSLRIKTLCFFAKAKKVYKYKKSYKFHAVENFFKTGKIAFPELELDKNISLNINSELKEKISTQLSNKVKICFNTGANSSRQGRKWQIDNWIKLAKMLLEKHDVEIYAVGSQEDAENVNKLVEQVPQVKSFAGKTSLQETAALLACADIVISGDTGPLHIASALDTTCIGLYGCCSISRSGPYGEKHYTIKSDETCAPCDKRTCAKINSEIDDTPCMRKISPEKVLNLVDIILTQK